MKRILTMAAVALLAAMPAAADCPSMIWSNIETISGYVHWVEAIRPVDYDHDGKPDLVGAVRSQNDGSSILHTWRGEGDGTFEAAVSLGTTSIVDLEIANVNNDAYLDIVGTRYYSGIFVRLGNATGFDAPIVTPTNYGAYFVSMANFNNDSNPDILVTSFTSNLFILYTGNGNGTFTEVRRETVPGTFEVWEGTAGDFDNDTYVDVAIQKVTSQKFAVYFRNANGTFQPPLDLPAGNAPRAMNPGDFDEDGLTDFASVNTDDGKVDIYRNNGSRSFTRSILSGSQPGISGGLGSLAVVDVDGDSNLDLLAGGWNGNALATFMGQGNGTFATATWSAMASGPAAIAVANFDTSDSELEAAMGSFSSLQTAGYTCGTTQVNLSTVYKTVSTGQPSKLRSAVSGFHGGIGGPLGSVTFKEGASVLGTVSVDASGQAALDYNGFSVGDHTITAEFSGNSALSAATSASVVQRVINETSSITIALGSSTHGEPFQSTVTIMNRFNNSTNGWYYLTVDGVTETTQRYNSTPLTLTLSAGAHTVSAEYIGDAFDPPSTSTTSGFTTAKHAVTLTKSGDSAKRAGSSHSFQITVGTTTSPAPTGSVQLLRDGNSIGTVTLASGIDNFNISLPRGSHDMTALYAGDANYLTGSVAFRLDVLENTSLAIDARALDSTIAIPAVIPGDTTSATMFRRVHGTGETWAVVPSWTTASPLDTGTFTRGVLYDYRLHVTITGGGMQQSNIDSALLFTDPTLTVGSTLVKLTHFTELRDSINALRTMAGLPDFAFDGTFGAGAAIRASHLTAIRTAVSEARTMLGMLSPAFTDGSPAGVKIKKTHILELRDATR